MLDVEVGDRVEAGQVLVRLAGSEKLAAAVESRQPTSCSPRARR